MPKFERVVTAIANLARPTVLYLSALSSAIVTVWLARSDESLIEKAAYIGAAWGGVAVLYGAKSLEEGRKAKAEASVAIAREGPADRPPWAQGDERPDSE